MDISDKTIKELRDYCRLTGIKGYSNKTKYDLIRFIKLADMTKIATGGVQQDITITNNSGGVSATNKIGLHVDKGKNLAQSIINASELYPLQCIQIFSHGPRTSTKVSSDYKEVRAALGDKRLYIHSSYTTNPWGDWKKHAWLTLDQFKSSMELGGRGVVIHLPKDGADFIAERTREIADALSEKKLTISNGGTINKIILEMRAVKQDPLTSYESPEKLLALVNRLQAKGLGPHQVGLCIDTAHIYAGQAQIRTAIEADVYLRKLEPLRNWIALMHINGNEYDSNIRAGDKHALPLSKKDKVWSGLKYEESGCRTFIEWCWKAGVDFILEIGDDPVGSISKFVEMINKTY
jgi:endonuclease IV